MNAEVEAQAAQQAASDKFTKLPGIPRKTKAQNIAYLNQAVFGRENEHLFLRHIVGFIPRDRFEEGEGEEEERLRANIAKQQLVVKKMRAELSKAHARLKVAQAKQNQMKAEIDALEQVRRLEALQQFPGSEPA